MVPCGSILKGMNIYSGGDDILVFVYAGCMLQIG